MPPNRSGPFFVVNIPSSELWCGVYENYYYYEYFCWDTFYWLDKLKDKVDHAYVYHMYIPIYVYVCTYILYVTPICIH